MPEVLDRLSQFDTPTICNVIELFDCRPRTSGYTNCNLRSAFPELPPAVGFACTAKVRASQPPGNSGDLYRGLESLLDHIQQTPARTMVVLEDLDRPSVGATFGEVLCSVFKSLRCVGLVSSGAGRDFGQIREMGFPLFVGATLCSHAYCQFVESGSPVTVGGLAIEQANLLHGDANGMVQVPVELAAEIVDVAPEFLQAESIVTAYAHAPGTKSAGELLERRRAMGDAIASLRNRVSRARQ